MPVMAGVTEARGRARSERIKALVRLFRPVAGADCFAMLLLDMSDADWRLLDDIRRIEAGIRHNAARSVARAPQLVAARKARRIAQAAADDA